MAAHGGGVGSGPGGAQLGPPRERTAAPAPAARGGTLRRSARWRQPWRHPEQRARRRPEAERPSRRRRQRGGALRARGAGRATEAARGGRESPSDVGREEGGEREVGDGRWRWCARISNIGRWVIFCPTRR
ncbi:hypothetical protein U9M48_031846 [Paspalum notatum var. saurae]|uniref:Uncharacterized protein n=1 Tax=Paspalum notatum var. saurae TaxID=547442 RepID=A0AAQ3U4S3_PASNO